MCEIMVFMGIVKFDDFVGCIELFKVLDGIIVK